VKVFIFDGTPNTAFQGHEVTNGDGTVEIYGTLAPTSLHQVQYVVDYGSTTVGTIHEDGTASPAQIQQQTAPTVNFSNGTGTPIQLGGGGTINLPAGGELKGIVKLTVNSVPTPVGNLVVQLRQGGVTGASRTVTTRTSSDGSYSISVPGGSYDRVCAFVAGTANACPAGTPLAGSYGFADNVTVTNGQSTTAPDIVIP
jgi:hypothetical protein